MTEREKSIMRTIEHTEARISLLRMQLGFAETSLDDLRKALANERRKSAE